jgi:hypothetical protein
MDCIRGSFHRHLNAILTFFSDLVIQDIESDLQHSDNSSVEADRVFFFFPLETYLLRVFCYSQIVRYILFSSQNRNGDSIKAALSRSITDPSLWFSSFECDIIKYN